LKSIFTLIPFGLKRLNTASFRPHKPGLSPPPHVRVFQLQVMARWVVFHQETLKKSETQNRQLETLFSNTQQ
jgi:hypothetical protein